MGTLFRCLVVIVRYNDVIRRSLKRYEKIVNIQGAARFSETLKNSEMVLGNLS